MGGLAARPKTYNITQRTLDIDHQILTVCAFTLLGHSISWVAISSALTRTHPVDMGDYREVKEGIGEFRPRGECPPVEDVDLITEAIATVGTGASINCLSDSTPLNNTVALLSSPTAFTNCGDNSGNLVTIPDEE